MCGIVLHVALNGDFKQGLTNMKYALNHDWKFKNYHIAWLCGFMQAFNVIIVELVAFTALLTYGTVQKVIMNFLALVVISHFGEFFFTALTKDPFVNFVEGNGHYGEFLVIQRTTSSNAATILNNAHKSINKIQTQPCEEEHYRNFNARQKEA